uniref:Uncharacterized protein n=1 Tax=viral metagenome TaxID=1070528 RepID=A0A6C0IYL0_9ZZZZ
MSRNALMSRVQAGSHEAVFWIDCGFYLMPVTLSKLSQFNVSMDSVKVVSPLDSMCNETNPVFESSEIPKLEEENEEEEKSYRRKQYRNFPCNFSVHSIIPWFLLYAFT